MSKVLLVAEHDGTTLNSSTSKAMACATAIGGDGVDVAVFAADGSAVCEQAASLGGAARVLNVERPENAAPLAAVLAPQIAALAAEYTHVLLPSTTFGKDVMPRVAALLGLPAVTDVMEVTDARTFKRPIYAGNALVTVQLPEGLKMVGSVRVASFKPVELNGSATIEKVALEVVLPSHTRFVELRQGKSDRPDLQSASKVVSGGRGVGSGDNFAVIFSLADKLGAGVGASRAAVDAGFVPNDMQVGQTGKIIAPDLYIAVGISGAIQHLAGIKDAGTIVAINSDADAPIFEVADLGLVGDLFELVPALEKALP